MGNIHLVDQCLIVFMAVLLVQSAYCLFFRDSIPQSAHEIDIIVRTSCASIFGYFLSANFIRHAAPNRDHKPIPALTQKAGAAHLPLPQQLDAHAQNSQSSDSPQQAAEALASASPALVSIERQPLENPPLSDAVALGDAPLKPKPTAPPPPVNVATASRLQIIVATAIGLFCLLTLILLRNTPALARELTSSPSAAATMTQFRDFVAGCVGFLIGCPTNHTE